MVKHASDEKRSAWKERIQQQQASNLSIEKWCRQHQIRPHTFHYWKEKLFPKQLQRSSFAELNVKRPDAISLQAQGIYTQMNSHKQRLRSQST